MKPLHYILIISLNLVFAGTAIASGGGQGEHAFTWRDWLWPVINFGLLAFVLVFFGRKPAKEFFSKRTEMIEKSLQEATAARELAEKTLAEVKARFDNTDDEVEEILRSAKKAGEREKESIIAEGHHLKEKILEQARANIEFELEKARSTIKSDAALLALELAEKQITDQMGNKEQEVLVDDYIKRLEDRN